MQQQIVEVRVEDVRFPTSLQQHGSDAMLRSSGHEASVENHLVSCPQHPDPDYSAAYVVLETDGGGRGYGLTFTLGRGTQVVVCAVEALSGLLLGKTLEDIVDDFRGFYRLLTSDSQMRWIGPEKGAIHLATAALLNAVWDLWARVEGKPLWKLLVDLSPEQLVSCVDFRYISDALTEQQALDLLREAQAGKAEREQQMLQEGYPAYTTSCAWLGYSDQQLTQLCTDALASGWSRFKVKVGAELKDDERRCRLIRQMIGPDKTLVRLMISFYYSFIYLLCINKINKIYHFIIL
ncbi:Mitochondrial enolase superfamily member 1 [Merluccius polli]|uniref:Mitochondrial enolase superfamily member 1 n=1 Tax=Merluccius polli TaxID=89951 RepID=A0AA47MJD6_MERPO|nr:Mitochondrial enolase superfamily member 1 [Merluccius polli]